MRTYYTIICIYANFSLPLHFIWVKSQNERISRIGRTGTPHDQDGL